MCQCAIEFCSIWTLKGYASHCVEQTAVDDLAAMLWLLACYGWFIELGIHCICIYLYTHCVSWHDWISRIISPRLWSSPLCMMFFFPSIPLQQQTTSNQAWKQHYKETKNHGSMFQEPTKPQTFYTANPSSLELIRRFPAFAGPSGLEFGLLWVLYLARFDKWHQSKFRRFLKFP